MGDNIKHKKILVRTCVKGMVSLLFRVPNGAEQEFKEKIVLMCKLIGVDVVTCTNKMAEDIVMNMGIKHKRVANTRSSKIVGKKK